MLTCIQVVARYKSKVISRIVLFIIILIEMKMEKKSRLFIPKIIQTGYKYEIYEIVQEFNSGVQFGYCSASLLLHMHRNVTLDSNN